MGDNRVTRLDAKRNASRRQQLSWLRPSLLVAIALMAFAGLLATSHATPAYAVLNLVVDSDGDDADVTPDGFCDADPTAGVACTLRAALQEAAADPVGPHTITFNIPESAP